MAHFDQESAERMRNVRFFLSENLGRDSKLLFRELGLSYAQIAKIEYDFKHKGYRELIYHLLMEWELNEGRNATVEKLIRALKRIKRNDLAYQIQYRISKPEQQAIINELKVKLKQLYTAELQLPQFPWTNILLPLDELFLDLETVEINKLQDDKKDEKIRLTDIFNQNENRKLPRRILIEGSPGCGKTTLALKILSDWSKGEPYVQQFQAAFMFQLRHLWQCNSFEEAIKQECQELVIDEQKVIDYFQENQEEILLIMDGFDDVNDTVKHNLTPLIKRQKLPNVTIIVTCRQGWFVDENTEPSGKSIVGSEAWDKRILIRGVTEQGRNEFLKKYFGNDERYRDALKFLENTKMNPSFLFLLTLSVDRQDFKGTKSSKTSLFKFFVNSIFKNHLLLGKEINENTAIDLFVQNPAENIRKYIHHFASFGKLSLQHLFQNRFAFEEKELLKCADGESYFLNLGLLTKGISLGKRRRNEFYDLVDKTFLYFSAAFYLSLLSLHLPMHKEFRSWFSQLVETRRGFDIDSHIFPFLAGLMKGKASFLFELLKPQTVHHNIENSETLRNILAEIEDDEEDVISYLVHLVPPELKFRTLISTDTDWVIRIIKVFCQRSNEFKSIKITG